MTDGETVLHYNAIKIVEERSALEEAAPLLIFHLLERASKLDAVAKELEDADWGFRSAIENRPQPAPPAGTTERRSCATVVRWHAIALEQLMAWDEPRTWFLLQLEAQSLLQQTEAGLQSAGSCQPMTIFAAHGPAPRSPGPGLLRKRRRAHLCGNCGKPLTGVPGWCSFCEPIDHGLGVGGLNAEEAAQLVAGWREMQLADRTEDLQHLTAALAAARGDADANDKSRQLLAAAVDRVLTALYEPFRGNRIAALEALAEVLEDEERLTDRQLQLHLTDALARLEEQADG